MAATGIACAIWAVVVSGWAIQWERRWRRASEATTGEQEMDQFREEMEQRGWRSSASRHTTGEEEVDQFQEEMEWEMELMDLANREEERAGQGDRQRLR